MSVVGNLDVNVRANTRKFDAGMTRARKSLFGFSKTSDIASGAASKLMGVLAGVAGVAAFTSAVSRAREELDSLAKTSAKLGVASENLAGLQLAASQTGVSTNTMNMALQRMVRRVAEASQGTGEAVKALQELGLSATQLAAMSPDEQFKAIAAAMQQVESQSDKVRLAFKLFDSEGVALVNTLNLGADGLERMQAEAERLGMAISNEDLAKVEKLNDAMDKLGRAFNALTGEILIDIAPAATEAIQLLADTYQLARGREVSRNGKAVNPETTTAGVLYNWMFSSGMQRALGSQRQGYTAPGQLTADERSNFQRIVREAPTAAQERAMDRNLSIQRDLEFNIGNRIGDALDFQLPKIGAAMASAYNMATAGGGPTGMSPADIHRMSAAVNEFLLLQQPNMPAATRRSATPALNLTESGSVESYRQQARMRRADKASRAAEETAKNTKQMAEGIDFMKDNHVALMAAGIA